jgi:hypothetical protein
VASWVVAASVAQAVLDPDIERAVRRLEQRLEQQLDRHGAVPADQQPERSHELESIEPWELVGV